MKLSLYTDLCYHALTLYLHELILNRIHLTRDRVDCNASEIHSVDVCWDNKDTGVRWNLLHFPERVISPVTFFSRKASLNARWTTEKLISPKEFRRRMAAFCFTLYSIRLAFITPYFLSPVSLSRFQLRGNYKKKIQILMHRFKRNFSTQVMVLGKPRYRQTLRLEKSTLSLQRNLGLPRCKNLWHIFDVFKHWSSKNTGSSFSIV